MLKIVSPTGCVHIVDNAYSDKLLGRVTLCNHVNYRGEHGEQFRHHWPSTTSTVTCKRCLASLKRSTGQHSSAVDMVLIEHVITDLGKDIVRTDKRFKAFFVVISKQCSFRKPTKMMSKKVDTTYQCSNPQKLVDPFNWRCNMGACPWMNRALDWRANNDM